MRSKVVTDYLARIRKELHGLDAATARSVIEELENHIQEKSRDLAEERGLDAPDEGVYSEVIEGLGPPHEVVVDYLRVLPKRLGLSMRLFLLLQITIGVAALMVGIDQLRFSYEIITERAYETTFLLSMVLIGVTLLLLGSMTVVVVWMQHRRPQSMLHYGAGSSMLSLGLATGLLLVMSKPLVWRHSETDIREETLYSIAVPLFLLVVFGFILGLRSAEDFQRRFALEELDGEDFAAKRRRSTKAMVSVMVVSLLLVSAIGAGIQHYEEEIVRIDSLALVSSERLEGLYNAELEHRKYQDDSEWRDIYRIRYSIGDADYWGIFFPEMRSALDWIGGNTPENATILCWWDYGHAVRGYSGREAIIYYPSRSLKNTVADPSTVEDWEAEERVANVARALVATNTSETIDIMDQYGSEYLLTNRRDTTGISYAFFQAAGLDILDYVVPSSGGPFDEPTEKGRQTLIFRIWAGEDIPGMELVYSDLDTRVFKPS